MNCDDNFPIQHQDDPDSDDELSVHINYRFIAAYGFLYLSLLYLLFFPPFLVRGFVSFPRSIALYYVSSSWSFYLLLFVSWGDDTGVICKQELTYSFHPTMLLLSLHRFGVQRKR